LASLITRKLKQVYAFALLKQPGLFLLIVSVIIGALTFREYGMAWDERQQRVIGLFNWNYLFNADTYLLTFSDNHHGAAFELFLISLEKIFHPEDLRGIFLMRHLVTHLLFLLSGFFCYKLIFLLYEDKMLACIGFLLFILHPQIYAHSFFNSKDLPFLSLFMICLYLNAKNLQNKTMLNSILLGACLALLINIRLMGVLLVCCVLLQLAIDAIREKKIRPGLKAAGFVTVSLLLVCYATWPYLWADPLKHFLAAFKSMSHYTWQNTNLFNGKLVDADKLGWEYIPVWFSVTSPLPYLLAGVFGIACCIYLFIKKPFPGFRTLDGICNLGFLLCFFLPVLAIIVLKSVLYDGWRHLFFIYPSFVMLGVLGLHTLLNRYKKIVPAAALIVFLYIGTVMIFNFPFQHVYFNSFVTWHSDPEYLRKQYDLDYWGTSFKQSFEYILKKDPSPSVTVFVEEEPGIANAEFLLPSQRARIRLVPKEEAMYYITNYRWHPQDYPFEEKKVHSIKVLGSTINAVYKLK